jgi:hypothetical protein
MAFPFGGPAMLFENFSPVVLAPRLKEELWMIGQKMPTLEEENLSRKALRMVCPEDPRECFRRQQ